jgi:uncharacterized membrane protein (DUF373 family)
MSDNALANLLGFLLLLAVIGLLWVWARFGERRKKGRRRDD